MPIVSITESNAITEEHRIVCLNFYFEMQQTPIKTIEVIIRGKGTKSPGVGIHRFFA